MKKIFIALMTLMLCLVGCSKDKLFTSEDIVKNLIEEGIPETSIKETEKDLYTEIYIRDRDLGYANIYVYKNVSDAKKFWENLDERYDGIEYLDDATAVGDLKDVCDASIEEWVHYEKNVIIAVEQYVANEWATYIGDDGEEYYGDGTKVSDVPSATEQRNKAAVLENMIINCLNSDNKSSEKNTTVQTEEKAGGNWSSMYGGNYAKILYEDFGLERDTAIDIGAVLEKNSCDVNEVYEVTEDGEYGYYISYKDNAGTTWENLHVVMSEGDHGYWLVDESEESE